MKRFISFSLFLVLSVLTLSAQEKLLMQDVLYANRQDDYSAERCKLDVWADETWKDTKHPIVVWFHGGGLVGGNKFIPEQLKNRGIAVVAANYRFLYKVGIKECIDDAAAAVAWVFKHAEEFGGDTSRIYVSGHSAGGYLTSMVGLDKSYLSQYEIDADSIRALVPFSGQAMTHYEYRKMTGGSELAPTIDETAPIAHMRKDCPPYIIISGDRNLELYGRYEENAYMWRMMNLIGHPKCLLYELDGFSHGSMAEPAFYILSDYIRRDIK